MPLPKTVDEMLLALPRSEQVIAQRLRHLVVECLPFATEKPCYGLGVPYYSHHRQICYIFPSAAVCEEDKRRKEGVTLGFCQGHRMANEGGILQTEHRKQALTIHFLRLSDLDEDQIRAWLFEAASIDDQFITQSSTSKA